MFYNKNKISNLIDIELVYIRDHSISRRLLVEGNQNVETLCNTIKDILEIFPKLSDLTNLSVSNLKKKNNKEWVELNMNIPIENQINQKDTVYFDLNFEDVWIDVIMTLKEEEDKTKIYKFSFELKTNIKKGTKDLEKNLIYSGISICEPLKRPDDYYLFIGIDINLEDNSKKEREIKLTQQLENSKNNSSRQQSNCNLYNNQSNDNFSFNDKISCTLKFINFTNYICNYVNKEITKISKKNLYNYGENNIIQEETMNSFKEIFNSNFRNLYLQKTEKIIDNVNAKKKENKILIKVSSEYIREEEELNYNEFNSLNNSPVTSSLKNFGPHISIKSLGKRDIEMKNIIQESGNYSFQIGNNRNSINSILSFNSSNYEKMSEKIIDFEEKSNEEINNIMNEIDFDNIFDNINSYIVSSSFKDCNDGRTRNLKILEGEIFKNSKLGSKEDAIKNTNTAKTNIFKEVYENYNHHQLLKKYTIIFIVIILAIVFIKIIF